jgi:hypothetical protein
VSTTTSAQASHLSKVEYRWSAQLADSDKGMAIFRHEDGGVATKTRTFTKNGKKVVEGLKIGWKILTLKCNRF